MNWKKVSITMDVNKIIQPASVVIPPRDKLKIRCVVKWEPLLSHIMPKQDMTWIALVNNDSAESA